MHIVHLSASDKVGGAARAAHRLHEGLKRIGVDSEMLVGCKSSTDPRIQVCRSRTRLEALEQRILRPIVARGARQLAIPGDVASEFSYDRATLGSIPLNRLDGVGLVHLHFVAGFLDLQSVLVPLSRRARLIWTLHDMNPLTGGCHYSGDCLRFNLGCGCCPQLDSHSESDVSRKIWTRKRRIFERIPSDRLCIVAPSRWLSDLAQSSALLGRFRCQQIPYGLDTEVFAPLDRVAARRALGLAEDKKYLLFAAASLKSPRKGFGLLLQALENLKHRSDLVLLSVGGNAPQTPRGLQHVHLGSVQDDRLLKLMYNAADIYVIPSLEDNLPNTVMEAMACGRAVVAFDVGGIPDMVRQGETGLLVAAGDTQALAAAIDRLLADNELCARFGEAGREIAIREYSLERQARDYLRLYRELIGSAEN